METICSNCWYENEKIRFNINGRCDECGGISFIDPGEFESQDDVDVYRAMMEKKNEK